MRRVVPLLVVLLLACLPTAAGEGAFSVLGVRPGMTVAAAREALAARGGKFRARGEKDGVFRWRWKGRAKDLPGGPEVTVRLEAERDRDDAPVTRVVLLADEPGPVAREWREALAQRWGDPVTPLVDLRDPRSGYPVEGTVWRRDGAAAVMVVAKEGTPRGIVVRRIALFLEPDFDPVAMTRRRYREIRGR